MSEGRYVFDCLLDRPSNITVNVNGLTPKDGKTTWRAIVWINGYAFSGIDWDTREEADRDRDRVMDALLAWKTMEWL